MKRREDTRTRKIVGWLVAVALLLAVWWCVLPPQLGGRTTLFVTKGISMEPYIHQGDLAVLHKSSHYQVGEVIAFHARTLNAISLHRIVSIDENGITTKGDNNSWDDLDHPTNKQIIGKMDDLYPGKGKYITYTTSLAARAILAALVGVFVFMGLKPRRNSRQRSRLSARSRMRAPTQSRASTYEASAPDVRETSTVDTSESTSVETPEQPVRGFRERVADWKLPRKQLPQFFSALLAISLLVSLVGFTHPIHGSKNRMVIYNLYGTFGYSAQAPPGGDLVYANGQVSTGDPIYLSMINNLFLTYQFRFDGSGTFKGDGTISTVVVLSGRSGWSHQISAGPDVHFTNGSGTMTTLLDLTQLRSLSQQVQQLTHVADGGYTITIKPNVQLQGTFAGQHVNETFDSALSLSGDNSILRVTQDAAPSTPAAQAQTPEAGPLDSSKTTGTSTGLNTSKGGSLQIPAGAPTRLAAFGESIGVETLRTFGVIGVLGSSIALLLLYLAGRRPGETTGDTHKTEEAQYRELLVDVAGWGVVNNNSMIIDVPALGDLARIAEQHSALILHQDEASAQTYVVNHGHLTYRYRHAVPDASERFGDKAPNATESKQ